MKQTDFAKGKKKHFSNTYMANKRILKREEKQGILPTRAPLTKA